ncbi:MAG: hypothetical protein KGM47_12925 [Acidobacteriota bacterium]|nr:hypothetical protein [Acidobacteriota bacterium]
MGFGQFIGNSEAVSTLRRMLANDCVPGSMLFSGTDGAGKKTLAKMLAMGISCARMKDDFCGKCPQCLKTQEMLSMSQEDLARRRGIKDASRRTEGLVYFDVQLIEPITRYILTEQIRQLRAVAYTRPFELPARVFIVEQAQAIHWQAADLLLKVMEEPPPTTFIILICSNPGELRATIRSRCYRLPFAPADDVLIERLLAEEKHLTAAELALALRVAGGSIAAAKSLDLAEFQRRRKPWVDYLNAITSSSVRSASAADWKALFEASKALAENRNDLEGIIKLGYLLLSDMLRALESASRAGIVNLDLEPRLKVWASKLGREGIERLKNGLDEARRLETRNVNQQLGWDVLGIGARP